MNAQEIEVALIDDDGREGILRTTFYNGEALYAVCVPVPTRTGVGQREFYLTGERDGQGRPIYRPRVH